MAGLAGCLGEAEYTVTDVRVGSASGPFGVDVSLVEPDAVIEHPARLDVAVTNQQSDPLRVRNTGIWPFGLLELVRSPDTDNPWPGTLLWTRRYEESQYIEAVAEDRSLDRVRSTPLVRTLEPRATASETYELHGDDIDEAGTRYVRGRPDPPLLEYAGDGSDEWTSFLPEIEVELEGTDLL
jgi:hypothetical protein